MIMFVVKSIHIQINGHGYGSIIFVVFFKKTTLVALWVRDCIMGT